MGEATKSVRDSQAQSRNTMKALVYEKYGAPEVLRLADVDIPVPARHEALIAVRAASVNSWDWDLLRGKPYLTRLGALFKPRYRILGADVAGVVVATGADVQRLKAGDEVFGDISSCGWGGFAEYVCAHEQALTRKPEGLSFAQAAAIPQAAVLALQGLRDQGKLSTGQQLLINGAGGGVGTFAIQYAKLLGAQVTGVDHADKLEAMRLAGADHVINYAQQDFSEGVLQYDVIIDVVGTRSVFALKRVLKSGGRYVMVGGATSRILQTLCAAPFIYWLEKKSMQILIHKPNHHDQLIWKELVEKGEIVPVIDRQYSLSNASEAMSYFGTGKVKGKLVIAMEQHSTYPHK